MISHPTILDAESLSILVIWSEKKNVMVFGCLCLSVPRDVHVIQSEVDNENHETNKPALEAAGRKMEVACGGPDGST